jgi:hypothetical protein
MTSSKTFNDIDLLDYNLYTFDVNSFYFQIYNSSVTIVLDLCKIVYYQTIR